MDAEKRGNFIAAFTSNSGGCRCSCHCGREFYDPNGGWDFEDGEIEKLQADANATALDYSVETIIFDGREYVTDCTCWLKRAERIVEWMDHHIYQIADYLQLEKDRKQQEAKILKEQ